MVATLESVPKNATHWSRSKMAERSGLSKSTIGRIWRAFGLKPHRTEHFKLSNDPLFVEKVYDICGLYINPPEAAVVLCVRGRKKPGASLGALPSDLNAHVVEPSVDEGPSHRLWCALVVEHVEFDLRHRLRQDCVEQSDQRLERRSEQR